jgi:hypothetical protein
MCPGSPTAFGDRANGKGSARMGIDDFPFLGF